MKSFKKALPDIINIIIISILAALFIYGMKYTHTLSGDIGDAGYAPFSSIANFLAKGDFPLFNPTLWGGIPNTGYFYQIFSPIMLLFFKIFYNPETGVLSYYIIEAIYIVSFIILANGCYFLTRTITKNKIIAFCSAVLGAFSAGIFFVYGWLNILAAVVCLPWLIAFFVLMTRLKSKYGYLAVIGLGITIGYIGLTGVTHGTLWAIAVFALLYAFYIFDNRDNIKLIKSFTFRCFVAGFIGMALCSIQLLPVVEFMQEAFRFGLRDPISHSTAQMSLYDFTVHSATLDSIKAMLGNGYDRLTLGIVVAITTLMGFFYKAKTNKFLLNFAKFLFIFSFLYCIAFVVTDIVWYIPYLNAIREPFLYSAPFAIAAMILSTFGLKAIFEYAKSKTIMFYAYSSLIFTTSFILIASLMPHVLIRQTPIITILSLLFFIIIFIKKVPNKINILSGILIVCTLLTYNNMRNLNNISAMTIKDADTQVQKVNARFKHMLDNEIGRPTTQDPYRTMQWGAKVYPQAIFPSFGYNDEFAYLNPATNQGMNVRGLDPIKRMIAQNIKYYFSTNYIEHPDLKQTHLLSDIPTTYEATEYVQSYVYTHLKRQGPAWLVYDFVPYNDDTPFEELQQIFNNTEFSPDVSALVNIDTAKNLRETTKGNISETNVIEYSADSMKIEVRNDNAGLLVTGENKYPGWKVFVDGKKTEISDVNYNFRGVWLEPGEHIVEFKFMPPLFYIGFALLIIGFTGILILLYLVFSKKSYNLI